MQHSGGGGDSISGKISAFDMDWSIGSGTALHSATRSAVRFGSSSSQTSQNSGDICRICHCESEPQNPLLTPCYCSGSLKFVHQSCLQQWLTASETNSCELCKFPFIMHTKIKPFNEWRALQMSGIERRRLFCSVLFHCAAATCVIWSLCVLIERATEEVKRGLISWPFWTKLVVVTVGLTGGVVFMYIQCKAYLSLCTRWRARNRILLIQNAPEKVAPPPQLPSQSQHQHHQQHHLNLHNHEQQHNQMNSEMRDSPPLMFSNNSRTSAATPGLLSNASGMGTQVSTMALNRSVYSAASHGQIVANIESNSGSSRQSRDWTNVQVEDMAFHSEDGEEDDTEGGFRCAELQPPVDFKGTQSHHHQHQQHNNYPQAIYRETEENVLSGGDASLGCGARRMFDEQQQQDQQQQHQHGYDNGRSKFNRQRHSLWVDSGCDSGGCGATMIMGGGTGGGNNSGSSNNQSDFRRYSDTRLMLEAAGEQYQHKASHQQQQQRPHQIFNVATAMTPQMGFGGGGVNQCGTLMTMEGTGMELEASPQITDILFESTEHGSSFDPLELNIQELLELDIRTNVRGGGGGGVNPPPTTTTATTTACVENELRSSRLSVNSDPQKYVRGQRTAAEQTHLLTPQSLPNLSASSENLLQQQPRQG